jgi:hypothetical protein
MRRWPGSEALRYAAGGLDGIDVATFDYVADGQPGIPWADNCPTWRAYRPEGVSEVERQGVQ